MTGLTRALRVDLVGLERHVSDIVSRSVGAGISASDLWADVRANAYGHGRNLVVPALRRAGISHFLDDDTMSAHDEPRTILNAEEMYGLVAGGTGFTSFVGEVVNVKNVMPGRRVSYGYTYETSRETTLALVALGYADGAARRASNLCDVAITTDTGVIVGRIAGRIAMDQLVVDVGGEHEVRVGSDALLWGPGERGVPTIHVWSDRTGIPPLTLASQVGFRVTREVAQ